MSKNNNPYNSYILAILQGADLMTNCIHVLQMRSMFKIERWPGEGGPKIVL